MEPIKDTVKNVMGLLEDKKNLGPQINPYDLIAKVLGKKRQRHIRFNYFKKGVLDISVDSSPWLYQLTLDKEELLQKLSSEAKEIKDIHFHVG